MVKVSEKSKEFIDKYVLANVGYTSIDENNIAEIIDYIVDNFEVPLAQAKEAGEAVDEWLLETATNVVMEITSDSDW